MNARNERLLTVLVDMATINAAYFMYYLVRVRSGWIPYSIEPDLLLPMIINVGMKYEY